MGSKSALSWLYDYLRHIFPMVDAGLRQWGRAAAAIEHPLLRAQAQASLSSKAFHCYGGAVAALSAPPDRRREVVAFIVALQTISDYLDNLCDRSGVQDEAAFFRLHDAMLAAVRPREPMEDYYDLYGGGAEHTYLPALVAECRCRAALLPSYHVVEEMVHPLVRYYAGLQAFKHGPGEYRQERLAHYMKTEVENPYGLEWWELAAATGSTLAMFSLFALAAWPGAREEQALALREAYFPWICGLHILLDYLIDQEEDLREGDLNFTFFYKNKSDQWEAMERFSAMSLRMAGQLEPSSLHSLTVRGLLAMYFSDKKTRAREIKRGSHKLIKDAGARPLFHLCCLVRRVKGI